jgi:hypothetical protein
VDDEQQPYPVEGGAQGISRRKVLVGGALAAGAVWVAPMITGFDSIASAASAQPGSSQSGLGFSYVSVLLSTTSDGTTTYYRLKYDYGNGVVTPVSGPTFANGPCFGTEDTSDPTYNANASSSLPPDVTGTYSTSGANPPVFTLTTTGYTFVGWVVHQGQDCFYGNPTNETSKNYAGPSYNSDGLNSTTDIVFPAAPNK